MPRIGRIVGVDGGRRQLGAPELGQNAGHEVGDAATGQRQMLRPRLFDPRHVIVDRHHVQQAQPSQ